MEVPLSSGFTKTTAALDAVFKMLECGICGSVSDNGIYVVGCCASKYCESCVNENDGGPCPCPNIPDDNLTKCPTKDLFSSDLLIKLKDLQTSIFNTVQSKSKGKLPDTTPVASEIIKPKSSWAKKMSSSAAETETSSSNQQNRKSEDTLDAHSENKQKTDSRIKKRPRSTHDKRISTSVEIENVETPSLPLQRPDVEKNSRSSRAKKRNASSIEIESVETTSPKKRETEDFSKIKNPRSARAGRAKKIASAENVDAPSPNKQEKEDSEVKHLSLRSVRAKKKSVTAIEKCETSSPSKHKSASEIKNSKSSRAERIKISSIKNDESPSSSKQKTPRSTRTKRINSPAESPSQQKTPRNKKLKMLKSSNKDKEVTDTDDDDANDKSPSPLKSGKQKENSPFISELNCDSAEPVKKKSRGSMQHELADLNSSSPILSTSFTSTGSVDKRNSKGETPLHVACRNGLTEKVKQLIIAGADCNAQDHASWTPLHEAINGKGKPDIKFEIVKYLCDDGSCNTNIPGDRNESALHEAARGGYKDIVGYLLSHGASPNVRNVQGELPRDVAANKAIVDCLDEMRNSSGLEEMGNLEDDPVVLGINLSKAVLYFDYDIPVETVSLLQQDFNLKVSKQLRGDVTHIIFQLSGATESREVDFSYTYLYGIATGAFMLGSDWIEQSISLKKMQSPASFEIQSCHGIDFSGAPKASRLNKELGNPGLLNGICIYFYKNSSYETIGKKDLINLIKLAGGEIIIRAPTPDSVIPLVEFPVRFHANNDKHELLLTSHIILYDERNEPPESKKYYMMHVRTLKTKWLIDSLGNFQLLDPKNHR